MNWQDLTVVLLWLAGVGSVFASNWLFGKIAESVPAWGKFPTWAKWILPPLVAVGFAFGAQALLARPDWIAVIQPAFSTIVMVIMGYFGSQLAHMQAKSANKSPVVIVARSMPDKVGSSIPVVDAPIERTS